MIVIYITLVNLIIALAYLVVKVIKKDYKRGLLMSGFMILAPVVGAFYLFFAWLAYVLYFNHRDQIISIEQLSYSKDRVKVIEKGNVQAALNKVPVEEALLVSNTEDTRKLLLDILKDDTSGYADSIYSATDHKDSEVSHYAATAITDIMDTFKKEEKMLRDKYLNNKKNIEAINSYWDYVSEFLTNKILSDVEQERYLSLLGNLVKDLENQKPEMVSANSYYTIAILYIELANMEKAKYWTNKSLDNKPNELESYKAGFKYYYAKRDGPALLKLIKELKGSQTHIDSETLEFIRFYNQ